MTVMTLGFFIRQIGEYDSDDEGGLWGDEDDGSGSDASWETESEHSVTETVTEA
jgi:hypothetical protein